MADLTKGLVALLLVGISIIFFANLWGDTGGCIGLTIGGTLVYLLFLRKTSEPNIVNHYNLNGEPAVLSRRKIINSYIAGVSFENRQEIINKLRIGDTLKVTRDYENQFDPNALGVYTREYDSVGYIPKDLAAEIAPIFDEFSSVPALAVVMPAKIIKIEQNELGLLGLQVSFNLPTKEDEEATFLEYQARDGFF